MLTACACLRAAPLTQLLLHIFKGTKVVGVGKSASYKTSFGFRPGAGEYGATGGRARGSTAGSSRMSTAGSERGGSRYGSRAGSSSGRMSSSFLTHDMRPGSQDPYNDMARLSHNLNHTVPYDGTLVPTVAEHDEDGYRYGGVTERIHIDREEHERTASGGHVPPAWRLPRDQYGGPPAPTLTERTGEFRHGGVTDQIYLDREEHERTASGGHIPPAWRLPRDEYGGPPAPTMTERTGEFRHAGVTDQIYLDREEHERAASGGHVPPAWRQPAQFAETVPDPPRYREGEAAGTAPHYVAGVDQRAAGRNRGHKHRSLGDKQPEPHNVQYSSKFTMNDQGEWVPPVGGAAADGTGKPGLTTGRLCATEIIPPQPKRKMRSFGMSTLPDDYDAWQTSNLTWKTKEHVQKEAPRANRGKTDEELLGELHNKSMGPMQDFGKTGYADVHTRHQKKSLGHTAPFLPIEGQNGWYGSKFALARPEYKVDKVPHPDEPLADIFTGALETQTEKEAYPKIDDYEKRDIMPHATIKLFNGKMDGKSETKAMHPLLVKDPTQATRPMSSVYDTIGPEKVVDGRFYAETRVAHTLDKGGWKVGDAAGRNNVPPAEDHYVTSTGRAHFHQEAAINSKSPEMIGKTDAALL